MTITAPATFYERAVDRLSMHGICARLAKCRTGVTAVELALVLPVFLIMILAVVEIGLEFLTQVVLDQAVAGGVRQVQMGKATTASSVTIAICGNIYSGLVPSCTTNIQLYLTSGTAFSALTLATVNSAGVMSPTTFSAGTSGSDILMQVAYARPYLFSMLSTIAGSKVHALISTVAVQNEPY